jgi:iron complex transport system substrate-binding protein
VPDLSLRTPALPDRAAIGRSASPARHLLRLLLVGLALLNLACSSITPLASSSAATITVTDIVGRSVDVKAPVQRMILGEGRQLYIVAALEPENPFKRVVGWRDDLMKNDLDAYNKYKDKFPQVAEIPFLGNPAGGEFSVEQAIALKPDLLVLNFDAYQGAQEAGLIDKLAKVGIPTVVIDFRQHPLENTVPSILLLGKLLGKEARAQEFVDFYLRQLNTVYSRVDQLTGEKPTVFLYRAAGFGECCATFGRANMGLLIERAGGVNIGSDLLPGWSGTINPEEVIAADPDLIIVTGANWSQVLPDGGYVGLGYSTSADQARQQLRSLLQVRGWETLQAARNERVHAIWHQFYNSPYHFVALQQFAKWLYPQEFTDVDPAQTFKEFHEQFLPIEYSGSFWTSLS